MITSQNGSVYEVVTSTSQTVRWLQYDAFGNKTEAAGPAGQGAYAYTPRQSYTGQTWIGSAGMYDYGSRFYDPRTGRFISNDPDRADRGLKHQLGRASVRHSAFHASGRNCPSSLNFVCTIVASTLVR
jgi:RHS repeat-associated protein